MPQASEDLFESQTPADQSLSPAVDIEDIGRDGGSGNQGSIRPIVTTTAGSTKRKRDAGVGGDDVELTQSWQEVLGPQPRMGTTRVCTSIPGEHFTKYLESRNSFGEICLDEWANVSICFLKNLCQDKNCRSIVP